MRTSTVIVGARHAGWAMSHRLTQRAGDDPDGFMTAAEVAWLICVRPRVDRRSRRAFDIERDIDGSPEGPGR